MITHLYLYRHAGLWFVTSIPPDEASPGMSGRGGMAWHTWQEAYGYAYQRTQHLRRGMRALEQYLAQAAAA